MGNAYHTNWIKKNMGISRKTLRVYMDAGLLSPQVNPENGYFEYDEQDLELIWFIKFLTEWKYSIKEIKDIFDHIQYDDDINFFDTLEFKIQQMEEEKQRIERLIGAAKHMKQTGYIPIPSKMGSVNFDEYVENIKEYLNVNNDKKSLEFYNFTQRQLKRQPNDGDLTEEDYQFAENLMSEFHFTDEDIDRMEIISDNLHSLSNEDPGCDKVQKMILIWHMFLAAHFIDFCPEIIESKTFVYGQLIAYGDNGGDLAKINEAKFGRQYCDFICDALEYYLEHNEKLEIGG